MTSSKLKSCKTIIQFECSLARCASPSISILCFRERKKTVSVWSRTFSHSETVEKQGIEKRETASWILFQYVSFCLKLMSFCIIFKWMSNKCFIDSFSISFDNHSRSYMKKCDKIFFAEAKRVEQSISTSAKK